MGIELRCNWLSFNTACLIIILMMSTAMAQSVDELKYQLQYTAFENDSDRIKIAIKLLEADPFNYMATECLCRYYDDSEIDSVTIYFDNLIAKYPGKTEPYLLRAELLYLEHDYHDRDTYGNMQIKYLKAAHDIDPTDKAAINRMVEVYYSDFIYPREKIKNWIFGIDSLDSLYLQNSREIKYSTFKHPADSALKYLYLCWDTDPGKRDIIYYPIRQLEYYLKIEDSKIPADADSYFETCFFPSCFFADLDQHWHCDSTVDYLSKIEMAKGSAEGLEYHLTDLKEECLHNADVNPASVIYRFTWLRTFHNPVCIRVEKTDEDIILYWKTGRGAGGYGAEGLKSSGKKKLKSDDWNTLQHLFDKAGFNDLPNSKEIPMFDGATWTLEKKTSTDFKAHYTNEPDEDFKEACLFLVKLAKIKVKEDEIY